jgi:exosortase A-associated hydrolase 2
MEPFYLNGAKGALFAVYHPAAVTRQIPQGLVYLPPFAEEMNRARRMAALQARQLAALGVDVLLLDPFGTGDSAGDFGEARWETWRDDAAAAVAWLRDRCEGDVGLWGLRLGALLAADLARDPSQDIARLLLWQPVHSGERYLTQFLRLRLAAALGRETDRETTKDLKARLAQGEPLEIGGYELAPALAAALSERDLGNLLGPATLPPIDWLEVSSAETPELSPASVRILEKLDTARAKGITRAVAGEPFWSIQEFTLAPALINATSELFRP